MTSSPIDFIYHRTHIGCALNIIELGGIKPGANIGGLGFGAVWLEDYYYPDGSRYGSVNFGFKFEKIVERKNLYKVKITPDFDATRILVTDKDLSSCYRKCCPFDSNEPFWFDNKTKSWRKNNNKRFHVVFDGELDIGDLIYFGFVDHTSDCQKYPCPDRVGDGSLDLGLARAKFMAKAIVENISLVRVKELFVNERIIFDIFHQISIVRNVKGYNGGSESGHDKVLEFCNAIVSGDDFGKMKAAKKFENEGDLVKNLADAVAHLMGNEENMVDRLIGSLENK